MAPASEPESVEEVERALAPDTLPPDARSALEAHGQNLEEAHCSSGRRSSSRVKASSPSSGRQEMFVYCTAWRDDVGAEAPRRYEFEATVTGAIAPPGAVIFDRHRPGGVAVD